MEKIINKTNLKSEKSFRRQEREVKKKTKNVYKILLK